RVDSRIPAMAQLRQREVGGELGAAIPDDSPVGVGVVRQSDRVSGYLTWVRRAEPEAHEHPGLVEQREELLLRAGGRRRGADLASQRDASWLGPTSPRSLLRLGAGCPPRCSAIRWSGRLQPEPLLRVPAGVAHAVEVIPNLRPISILPGQRSHDVN